MLRTAHPSITVEDALRCFDVLKNDAEGRDVHARGDGYATWKRTGHPFSPEWTRRWDDDGPGNNGGDDQGDDDRD